MQIDEKAEELLESLWIHIEDGKGNSVSQDEIGVNDGEAVKQLTGAGYISVAGDRVTLTEKGRPMARSVVRRHRLAERLLADVLGTGGVLMHEKACKFEHLLDHGLDESVCTLLGHPKVCPHAKPIPPGRCCRREKTPARKLVSALSQLTPGQNGKVAYVYAPESSQLQKLMAMGILPGAGISLVQNFPSFVFKIDQTQFAVDREIAEAIYVRLVQSDAAGEIDGEAGGAPPRRRGFGWRPGRWRPKNG